MCFVVACDTIFSKLDREIRCVRATGSWSSVVCRAHIQAVQLPKKKGRIAYAPNQQLGSRHSSWCFFQYCSILSLGAAVPSLGARLWTLRFKASVSLVTGLAKGRCLSKTRRYEWGEPFAAARSRRSEPGWARGAVVRVPCACRPDLL